MKKFILVCLSLLLLPLCSCTDATPSKTPSNEEKMPVKETFTATALVKCIERTYGEESEMPSREIVEQYHYAPDGRIRTIVSTDANVPKAWQTRYRYDEKGRNIAILHDRIGKEGTNDLEYRYDEQDRVIYSVYSNGREETTYTYDEEGRLKSQTTFRVIGDEVPCIVREYTYDQDGGFVESFAYRIDSDEAVVPTTSLSHVNADGLLVSCNKTDYDAVEWRFTYEYDFDEEGRVVERRELCKEFDGEVTEIVSWTYDEKGLIRSIVSGEMDLEQFEKDGTEQTDLVRIDLFYDEEGRLTQYTKQSETDGNLRREEYLYEYGAVEVEESLSGKDLAETELLAACPMVKGYLPWRVVE